MKSRANHHRYSKPIKETYMEVLALYPPLTYVRKEACLYKMLMMYMKAYFFSDFAKVLNQRRTAKGRFADVILRTLKTKTDLSRNFPRIRFPAPDEAEYDR
jgi:hypothetical protein